MGQGGQVLRREAGLIAGLNSVIFRRTKADTCKADGSPLFARRLVHTESFIMSAGERVFYRVDGQRMPSWERHLDKYLQAKPALSQWTETDRLARLREQVEPALDRELGQRGVLSGDGAYTAELIAWVELV